MDTREKILKKIEKLEQEAAKNAMLYVFHANGWDAAPSPDDYRLAAAGANRAAAELRALLKDSPSTETDLLHLLDQAKCLFGRSVDVLLGKAQAESPEIRNGICGEIVALNNSICEVLRVARQSGLLPPLPSGRGPSATRSQPADSLHRVLRSLDSHVYDLWPARRALSLARSHVESGRALQLMDRCAAHLSTGQDRLDRIRLEVSRVLEELAPASPPETSTVLESDGDFPASP